MIACDPTSFLRGRCNLFDASEKFSVTLRKVACDPSSFLCGRCKCLATMVTLPASFLCGRCNIFDASEKFLFCVAGAIFSMPSRSSPVTLLPFCRQCDFVALKPFPHPSPHPKTPVPPSYTLKGGCTYKAIPRDAFVKVFVLHLLVRATFPKC